MGKYQKNYCSSWEKDVKLKSWIQRVPRDDTKGTCRFCKPTVRCHYRDLCAHADTEKHKQNAAPCSSRRTLFDVGCARKTEDQSIKVAEFKLAVHVACHSSILTSDHLGEIVKDVSGRDISIHRTKCSALIKNVLCLVIRNDLFMDIQGMPYSLIIDESTDITAEKQFCVIVRYFSKAHKTILTGFLGMISLDSGTAEGIFNNMATFLHACHLDLAKCIGLATDGCSVMCGQSNSVITRFREVNNNIVHIKCICHSIQLCSSYALRALPRSIEFMVSETYTWFCHCGVYGFRRLRPRNTTIPD